MSCMQTVYTYIVWHVCLQITCTCIMCVVNLEILICMSTACLVYVYWLTVQCMKSYVHFFLYRPWSKYRWYVLCILLCNGLLVLLSISPKVSRLILLHLLTKVNNKFQIIFWGLYLCQTNWDVRRYESVLCSLLVLVQYVKLFDCADTCWGLRCRYHAKESQ